MISLILEKLKISANKGGITIVENTNQFVQNLHEKQKKDEQNRKRNTKRQASEKLPNKQH